MSGGHWCLRTVKLSVHPPFHSLLFLSNKRFPLHRLRRLLHLHPLRFPSAFFISGMECQHRTFYKRQMNNKRRRTDQRAASAGCESDQEVSSIEWECIKMTDQEEDLIDRMYGLVGNRWNLIAGRIPGRKPEEIERFWIMRHRSAQN